MFTRMMLTFVCKFALMHTACMHALTMDFIIPVHSWEHSMCARACPVCQWINWPRNLLVHSLSLLRVVWRQDARSRIDYFRDNESTKVHNARHAVIVMYAAWWGWFAGILCARRSHSASTPRTRLELNEATLLLTHRRLSDIVIICECNVFMNQARSQDFVKGGSNICARARVKILCDHTHFNWPHTHQVKD